MTLPLGFRYAATYAGIRKQEKDDLALIVPDRPAEAAAVFTSNVVKAAPVRLAQRNLRASNGRVAAVLVNAGNANCATRTGDQVALTTSKVLARSLRTKPHYIFPASTGVIGVELDPALITDSIPRLAAALSGDAFESVARAIMTTDTRPKIASEELKLKDGTVRVAGLTKGSGMIHPHMATTLGFVMTDANLPARYLREMLVRGIDRSFNSLTVDGDMSTNDTVALLASGASKVTPSSKERKVLDELVTWVLESLAEQIAADGEGARKLIVIRTAGFRNDDDARKVARAIANSPLVKTAIAGSDPNWGRILSAAGYAGVAFDPAQVDIHLQGVQVTNSGLAAEYNEAELKKKLDEPEIHVRVSLKGSNTGEARFFTCDLTEGYIQINGSYRS